MFYECNNHFSLYKSSSACNRNKKGSVSENENLHAKVDLCICVDARESQQPLNAYLISIDKTCNCLIMLLCSSFYQKVIINGHE